MGRKLLVNKLIFDSRKVETQFVNELCSRSVYCPIKALEFVPADYQFMGFKDVTVGLEGLFESGFERKSKPPSQNLP